MRNFTHVVTLTVLFFAGCNQGEEGGDDTASSSEKHREAVAKFQDGQKRFKELIATVRDEKSFDTAKPKLEKVVSDWREVATELGELEPPSKEQQAELRELIDEGYRATKATGEGMPSLISIESRQAEVIRWLKEFVAATVAAGAEIERLYGPSDYGRFEPSSPKLDLSNAGLASSPISEALFDPATLIQQDQEAEQGGADQPATAPESKSEGEKKPKSESEDRSQ